MALGQSNDDWFISDAICNQSAVIFETLYLGEKNWPGDKYDDFIYQFDFSVCNEPALNIINNPGVDSATYLIHYIDHNGKSAAAP